MTGRYKIAEDPFGHKLTGPDDISLRYGNSTVKCGDDYYFIVEPLGDLKARARKIVNGDTRRDTETLDFARQDIHTDFELGWFRHAADEYTNQGYIARTPVRRYRQGLCSANTMKYLVTPIPGVLRQERAESIDIFKCLHPFFWSRETLTGVFDNKRETPDVYPLTHRTALVVYPDYEKAAVYIGPRLMGWVDNHFMIEMIKPGLLSVVENDLRRAGIQ